MRCPEKDRLCLLRRHQRPGARRCRRCCAGDCCGRAESRFWPVFAVDRSSVSHLPNDPLASLPADAKVKLLERLEDFARAVDPRVVQVMVASLAGEYEVILVAGSDGRLAADIRPLVRCSISVIIEENGKREQGASGGGGRFDFAYFTDDVLQRYARERRIRRRSTCMPSRHRRGR